MKSAFVGGALANKPGNGGNAWTRLCWINGLRQLGYRVTFVEQLNPPIAPADAVPFFLSVMADHGLDGDAALLREDGLPVAGLAPEDLVARADAAELLVNISGHLTWPEIKERIGCRVYFDDDPGYTQAWAMQPGSVARLEGHHFYFTLGLNIGTAGCPIPTAGLRWRPLVPPVALSAWPVTPRAEFDRFTTVARWRGAYGPLQMDGKTYGQKAHEFRKFLALPQRSGLTFEVALDIDPADAADARALRAAGWRLADPRAVADSPKRYQKYVQQSGAEFSVAQGLYVETRSGWFSDRTARYLASGRPAVVQDTGWSGHLPTGEGLVVFRTVEEAVDAAQRVVRDYARHARAARAIAERYFDARTVIGHVLHEAGLT